jgi:nitrile hydratase subunit alpha
MLTGEPMREYDPAKAAELHEHIHSHVPSESALRVKALESLLVEKGMLDAAATDAWIELYRDKVGPKVGARVVARAWTDPDYKARLLADGAAGIEELGIGGHAVGHLKVVENTERVHNLVVCTLCSCYPHAVLGMSPAWYKKAAYRSRAVREPRRVLKEFGVDLPDDVAVDVWDSTAELRYLVMPQRPAGTESWDEAALANIVTRDSMIGVERALKLAPAAR